MTEYKDIYVKIGARIKCIRVTKKIKQVDVAKKMKLTFQQIQKYEAGKDALTIHRLLQFAKNLEVHPYILLGDTEKAEQYDLEYVNDQNLIKNLNYVKKIMRILPNDTNECDRFLRFASSFFSKK